MLKYPNKHWSIIGVPVAACFRDNTSLILDKGIYCRKFRINLFSQHLAPFFFLLCQINFIQFAWKYGNARKINSSNSGDCQFSVQCCSQLHRCKRVLANAAWLQGTVMYNLTFSLWNQADFRKKFSKGWILATLVSWFLKRCFQLPIFDPKDVAYHYEIFSGS